MSVVNQMLRELDRRRASATERAALPGMVRSLPAARPSVVRPALAGIALVTACGVATAAWLSLGRDTPVAARNAIPAPAAAIESVPQEAAAPAEPQLKWSMLLGTVPAVDPAPRSPRTGPDPSASQPEGPAKAAGGNLPRVSGARSAQAPAGEARTDAVPPSQIPRPYGGSGESLGPKAPNSAPAAADPPARAGEGGGGGEAATAAGAGGHGGEIVIDKRPAEGTQSATRDAAAVLREARALAQRGQAEAAAELLKRHGPAAAGDAEYRGLHAAVLQRLTLHAEAVEEYRAALRLAPNTSVWWLGLGISLESLGRAREAREAFERARAGNLSAELAAFADQRISALR